MKSTLKVTKILLYKENFNIKETKVKVRKCSAFINKKQKIRKQIKTLKENRNI